MTVLVTGSTGAVGSEAVRHLAAAGTQVRALTRSPNKAHFPAGVTADRRPNRCTAAGLFFKNNH